MFFQSRKETRAEQIMSREHRSEPSNANPDFARFRTIDACRGLIMVLMALDHANYFIAHKHSTGEYWGGPFATYSDPLAFLTRFVTHPCAPGFFFLMGVSMCLFAESRRNHGWSRSTVIRHFLIRGVLLIILQFLVENQAWGLRPDGFYDFYIGVLWALGGTMILSSFLLWLKPKILLPLTILLLFGMQVQALTLNFWGRMARVDFLVGYLLMVYPGGIMGRWQFGTRGVWSNYPILPWLGLVAFGIVFGYWFLHNPKKTSERGLKLAMAFFLIFLLVRYLNGFGNIRPMMGNTWIDFLNVVKYPPSITFILLTIGINLTAIGLIAKTNEKTQRFLKPLIVFGQVPLFFYVTHLFLYAVLGLALTPSDTSIPIMYLFWLLGLLMLYPLCLLYGRFKHDRPDNSKLRFF